jgi:hypothetical protein
MLLLTDEINGIGDVYGIDIGQVAGFSARRNEPSSSLKCVEYLD